MKCLGIEFTDDEIVKLQQLIFNIIYELGQNSIPVVFQKKGGELPIMPTSIHGYNPSVINMQFSSCQYRIVYNKDLDRLAYVSSMVCIENVKEIPILFTELLHEYCHTINADKKLGNPSSVPHRRLDEDMAMKDSLSFIKSNCSENLYKKIINLMHNLREEHSPYYTSHGVLFKTKEEFEKNST
jgi:hypothetical protein